MKKYIIVGSITIFIAVTALAVVLGGDKNSETKQTQQTNTSVADLENERNEEAAEAASAKPAGSYVDYVAGQDLASTLDTKRILFFHAEWCPTCRYYEKQIEENAIPEGVTIIKVNYDTETELKELLNVTVQSTFVLMNREGDVGRVWPYAEGLKTIQDLYDEVAKS